MIANEKAYKVVIISEEYQNSRGFMKMNTKTKFLSVLGAGLVSRESFAQDANNTCPKIVASDITVTEGGLAQAMASVSDADGDFLGRSYSIKFNKEGQWQTKERDAGVYTVSAIVTDGKCNAQDAFTVTVLKNTSQQETVVLPFSRARKDYSPLESEAGKYSLIMVEEGTPLYQVASTVLRSGADPALFSDSYLAKNELIKTSLCDDWKIRRDVSNANNAIARLTAQVAGEKGMDDLRAAMLLDIYTVKPKEGKSCSDPEPVPLQDGLIGDGFASLRGLHERVPVAIPEVYLPTRAVQTVTEVSLETPREESSSVVEAEVPRVVGRPQEIPLGDTREPARSVRENSYGSVKAGVHKIHESGEAPLGGMGFYFQLDNAGVPVGEKGTLAFDLNHFWGNKFVYENKENTVKVMDADMSVKYSHALSDHAHFTLGANLDSRSADVNYAGISAQTGQWAFGPEFGLGGRTGRCAYDLSASLAWGKVSTDVDIAGYHATKDRLLKAKIDAETHFDVVEDRFSLGGVARVESDTQAASTQDGGHVPQNEARYTFGPVLTLGNIDGFHVQMGLEDIMFHTQAGDDKTLDTNSLRYHGGVGYGW